MKLILVFLIFGSVIAAGSARKSCVTCKVTGDGVDNCQGAVEECENEDDFCATQIEYNILRGDNKQTVRKRCMPKNQWIVCIQQMFLNTTDEFQLLLYSKCCYTDGCNTEGIQMPPVNKLWNGKRCPSCFVEGSLECTNPGTVKCTGNQLHCLNFSGIAARPDDVDKPYAFQGCVTIGSCFVDLQRLPGSQVDKKAEYTCKTTLIQFSALL